METTNQFQLELAVNGYLQQLQTNGSYTSDDILELKSHLLDNVDELKQKQLSDEEAFIIAQKRLGKDEVLHAEYKKVNGDVFYNRDLFVIVLSICTYLLFSYLYDISQAALQYIALKGTANIYLWGIVNYILQIIIVSGFVYIVFKSKKYLTVVSRFFVKSPANFSAILILFLVIFYFSDIYFQKYTSTHSYSSAIKERFYKFQVDTALYSFVRILLGSVVLVSILAAFVTSYKKVKFLDSIINYSGYVALFFLGVFWDAVAASARMLNGIFLNDLLISSVAFGMIWFAGMLIFNFHLTRNFFKRNLVFVAFGFVMEFAAGMWMNTNLRNGLPVSIYFVTLILGSSLGYLAAQYFKKKSSL